MGVFKEGKFDLIVVIGREMEESGKDKYCKMKYVCAGVKKKEREKVRSCDYEEQFVAQSCDFAYAIDIILKVKFKFEMAKAFVVV